MNSLFIRSRCSLAFRWIARILSLMVLALALLITLVPEQDTTGSPPLPFNEILELGLYGLALTGLFIAWRWEVLGSGLVLLGVAGNSLVFWIARGYWTPGLLLPASLFLLPTALFMICWLLSRRRLDTVS